MLPRSVQKTLRLYRNRLSALWWWPGEPARRGGDDYRSRYGAQDRDRDRDSYRDRDYDRYRYRYHDPDHDRDSDRDSDREYYRERDRDRDRRKRRLKRRGTTRVPFTLVLLSVGVLVSGMIFAIHTMLTPKSKTKMRSLLRNMPHKSSSVNSQSFIHSRVNESALHAAGGWTADSSFNRPDLASAQHIYNHVHDDSLPISVAHAGDSGNAGDGGRSNTVSLNDDENNDEDNKASSGDLSQTRTCYTNGVSHAAVCVHGSLCVRRSSVAYLSEELRCAPYTEESGRTVSMTRSACVELERHVETAANLQPVEHQSQSWVSEKRKRNEVIWFEGDAVLLRLSTRSMSVTHFAALVMMVHHVIQHPHRYGLKRIEHVVVVAHHDVVKKLRYSKSWQHGLLAAVVHPSPLTFSQAALDALLSRRNVGRSSGIDDEDDISITAFVADESPLASSDSRMPCFHRVAVTGPAQPWIFLEARHYPGVTDSKRTDDVTMQYYDADSFRRQLFASLGYSRPPLTTKRVVYLHRAATRTLTKQGLSLLQETLMAASNSGGMNYQLVDVSGLTFPQQVSAVAGAAIVVGIHGTQMLNTVFLSRHAAVIEIFPYRFVNELFSGGSGAGLHYARHEVLHGVDYGGLSEFSGDVEECRKLSGDCRIWYQSDKRPINFESPDAKAIFRLVKQAMQHVEHYVVNT